jgi:meso-butanediol dehydrogenase/(S,S)-butanediol dehydrogenase/diacetyl reductase
MKRIGTRFQSQTAVVVGGGAGIGRATALRLAAEGCHVIVADSRVELAERTSEEARAAGGSAGFALVDATDAASVGRFFYDLADKNPALDVLINCPAHAGTSHFERVTESEFDLDIAATLKAPFLCIQAALPLLLHAPASSVVSVGSVNGTAAFGNEAYGAAKAGLVNLSKNLALRYGSHGVRFNVVAPGTVDTASWDARVAAEPDILERLSALYPLKRVGTAEDVAAACVFLASRDAAWITGTTLTVDGGITAGHGDLIHAIFGAEFFQTTVEARPGR